MSTFAETLQAIGENGHLPIGLVIFLVGSLVYALHGLDAAFVTFTGSVLTFLGGHMYIQNNNAGSTPLTPKVQEQ
jgi:hypothetical protein